MERRNQTKLNIQTPDTTYLVPQNLLLGDPVESLNVSNDDGHDQVDHDDGAKEDDAYQ